jgi:hypothetical protein
MPNEGMFPKPGDFFDKKSSKIPEDLQYKTGLRLGEILKEFLAKNPDILETVPRALLMDTQKTLGQVPDSEVGTEAPRLEKEFIEKLETLKNNLK